MRGAVLIPDSVAYGPVAFRVPPAFPPISLSELQPTRPLPLPQFDLFFEIFLCRLFHGVEGVLNSQKGPWRHFSRREKVP